MAAWSLQPTSRDPGSVASPLVIGLPREIVDRVGQAETLAQDGAEGVVQDLSELMERA